MARAKSGTSAASSLEYAEATLSSSRASTASTDVLAHRATTWSMSRLGTDRTTRACDDRKSALDLLPGRFVSPPDVFERAVSGSSRLVAIERIAKDLQAEGQAQDSWNIQMERNTPLRLHDGVCLFGRRQRGVPDRNRSDPGTGLYTPFFSAVQSEVAGIRGEAADREVRVWRARRQPDDDAPPIARYAR